MKSHDSINPITSHMVYYGFYTMVFLDVNLGSIKTPQIVPLKAPCIVDFPASHGRLPESSGDIIPVQEMIESHGCLGKWTWWKFWRPGVGSPIQKWSSLIRGFLCGEMFKPHASSFHEIRLGCLDSQFTDYDHIQSQKILYNHQPTGGLQPLPRYQENMVGHPQSLGLKCWAPGLSLDAKNPSRSWAKFTCFIPWLMKKMVLSIYKWDVSLSFYSNFSNPCVFKRRIPGISK